MSILDYIYNKNSLHVVNAMRIICVLAVILMGLIFGIGFVLSVVYPPNGDLMIFVFIAMFTIMGFVGFSGVGLTAAVAVDVVQYSKI